MNAVDFATFSLPKKETSSNDSSKTFQNELIDEAIHVLISAIIARLSKKQSYLYFQLVSSTFKLAGKSIFPTNDKNCRRISSIFQAVLSCAVSGDFRLLSIPVMEEVSNNCLAVSAGTSLILKDPKPLLSNVVAMIFSLTIPLFSFFRISKSKEQSEDGWGQRIGKAIITNSAVISEIVGYILLSYQGYLPIKASETKPEEKKPQTDAKPKTEAPKPRVSSPSIPKDKYTTDEGWNFGWPPKKITVFKNGKEFKVFVGWHWHQIRPDVDRFLGMTKPNNRSVLQTTPSQPPNSSHKPVDTTEPVIGFTPGDLLHMIVPKWVRGHHRIDITLKNKMDWILKRLENISPTLCPKV